MSSPAVTPALPLLPIAPLDGQSGYLRWKESVLLRLHTLGLAHVVSEKEEERPAAGEKQRARDDDALCRGHILATLSDRLLPAYAHHATAGAVWRAVARTYDLDLGRGVSRIKVREFRYDEGKPLLEQLALLEALVTVAWDSSTMACYILAGGFPPEVVRKVDKHGPDPPMERIWEIAQKQVRKDRAREIDHGQPTTDGQRISSSDGFRPRKRRRRQWQRNRKIRPA